ncbi:MAG TPA: ribonuclease III [Opitutaceae bacterium]|nr:ribonuclease III [Opitutaceae bacterium]
MATVSPTTTRLEQQLGYAFRDRRLLADALRHPSAASLHPGTPSNQRLEFLGDAVLQLIISEALYAADPDAREGVLSRRRSALTKGAFLVTVASELGIDQALELSPAEEQTGGRERASSLEDAFEALVGAIYLDGGIDAARAAVLGCYGPLDRRLDGPEQGDNPKGRLQELVQPAHGNSALRYEVIHTKGQPHDRHFDVHLHLLDRLIGTGSGRSKKEAEENAAREALRQWKTSAQN